MGEPAQRCTHNGASVPLNLAWAASFRLDVTLGRQAKERRSRRRNSPAMGPLGPRRWPTGGMRLAFLQYWTLSSTIESEA
jgi:hypothetical protein